MEQESDLEKFLDVLLSEGRHDSRGAFTLDYLRSKELLGTALFSHPANYLLKLIQGAMTLSPVEIRVRITIDTVQVTFRPSFTPPDLDALEESLQKPLPPQKAAPDEAEPFMTRCQRHLGLALRAALVQQPALLLWGYRDPHQGMALTFRFEPGQRDAQMSRVPLPSEGVTVGECVFQLRRPATTRSWWSRFTGRDPAMVDESDRLSTAAQFATIPIFLNGSQVNRPRFPKLSTDPPFFRWGHHYDILVERLILSKAPMQELMLAPPPPERQASVFDLGYGNQDLQVGYRTVLYQWRSFNEPNSALFTREPKLAFKPEGVKLLDRLFTQFPNSVQLGAPAQEDMKGEPRPAMYHIPDVGDWTRPSFQASYGLLTSSQLLAGHAYLLAPTQPGHPRSSLHMVQDGILLAPREVELALPGMMVVVADNAAKTDLSGLQVVEDERYERLLGWLRSESEAMKKNARSVIRFGEKLSMNPPQLKELRTLLEIEENEP